MDGTFFAPIVQLLGFVLGSIIVVVSMRHDLRSVKEDVAELKIEVKQFSEVLRAIAVTHERLDTLDRRYEELRHGEGFVFPLMAKLHGGDS